MKMIKGIEKLMRDKRVGEREEDEEEEVMGERFCRGKKLEDLKEGAEANDVSTSVTWKCNSGVRMDFSGPENPGRDFCVDRNCLTRRWGLNI